MMITDHVEAEAEGTAMIIDLARARQENGTNQPTLSRLADAIRESVKNENRVREDYADRFIKLDLELVRDVEPLRVERGRMLRAAKDLLRGQGKTSRAHFQFWLDSEELGSVSDAYACMKLAAAADPVAAAAEERAAAGARVKKSRAAAQSETREAVSDSPHNPPREPWPGVAEPHADEPVPASTDPVDEDAIALLSILVDFERAGLFARSPRGICETMTPHMVETVRKLAPRVAEWLKEIKV